MIDKLARYKVNAVIWELEDKLRYTRRPEVGAPNAIGKQEMQAICRYAEERNINISPLVQGLGHASFILKHHWELRESERVIGNSVLPIPAHTKFCSTSIGMQWKRCHKANTSI